ncbi:hypothetical protein GCM10010381_44060 [Streptomyces xantholiticus]|nr:hypothetical protein GCM10010381_44060 [Streptomyces xantholiticus]
MHIEGPVRAPDGAPAARVGSLDFPFGHGAPVRMVIVVGRHRPLSGGLGRGGRRPSVRSYLARHAHGRRHPVRARHSARFAAECRCTWCGAVLQTTKSLMEVGASAPAVDTAVVSRGNAQRVSCGL